MRKYLIAVVAGSVTLFSCANADKDVPEIANDFCQCFSSLERDLSADTKNIVARAAATDNPEAALQDELMKLPEEQRTSVATEMMKLGELQDDNSALGRCIKDVEKKHGKKVTYDEKAFAEKVVKELETKANCSFTGSLMKLGLKVQERQKTGK